MNLFIFVNLCISIVGKSFQEEKTRDSSITTAIVFSLATLFMVSIFAFDWLGPAVGAAFLGGGVYGAFTGFNHNLALKPWLCKKILL
jgi:hypothetical protein